MPFITRILIIEPKYSRLPIDLIDESGIRGDQTRSEFYGQISPSDQEHRCSLSWIP